jgi:hypothetical protein
MMGNHFILASWPGLSRPSTSWLRVKKDVDARHKVGHDARDITVEFGLLP